MSKKKKERKQTKTKKNNVNIPQRLNQPAALNKGIQKEHQPHNFLLILAIVIAGIIAYSNSFNSSFHFDDIFVSYTLNNFSPDSATLSEWIHLFPNRPLGILTFAANYSLNKLDVRGYHLVNLMIHLINAFLVWWLTFITFATPVMKNAAVSRHKSIIAFLTGLLFVTHPLATQSVTYIVQRFASLATLFYLLSLILYIRGRLWEGDRHITFLLFGASIVAAVCAMLTKEIAYTLPFAVVLYEFFFIKISPWKIDIKNKNLPLIFLLLFIFVFLFLRNFSWDIFDTKPPANDYPYSISMKEYFFTQFSVILTYIRLFLLPFNQNLDYDYPLAHSFFQIKTFFSFLILVGIFSAGIGLFKKYRLISFGIFWFFLTLSVESSIIPISQDVIYEHRTYLPSFGFFLAFTSVFFHIVKEKYFRMVLIFILMIAGFNTILTYQRNKIWRDDYTLWADCLKKSPHKARVNNNYANALGGIKGQVKDSLHYYDKAIQLNPNDSKAYNNRGNAYFRLGQYQRALENFDKAIHLDPTNSYFYYIRGWVYVKLGQYQRAVADFNEARRQKYENSDLYYIRGSVYAELGQYQQALEDFSKVIELKPGHADAYNNRAVIYLFQGKKALGCSDVQKACSLGNCHGLNWAKGKGLCL